MPASGKCIRLSSGRCEPANLPNGFFHGISQGCRHFYLGGVNKFLGHLGPGGGFRRTGFQGDLLLGSLFLPPLHRLVSSERVRFVHPRLMRWGSFVLSYEFVPVFTGPGGRTQFTMPCHTIVRTCFVCRYLRVTSGHVPGSPGALEHGCFPPGSNYPWGAG